MKLIQFLILVFALASIASADCDCTKAPYKPDPPCSEVCIPKVLSQANEIQLVTIFKLPADVSRKIVRYPARTSATSLNDYKDLVLTSGEIKIIKTKFKSLTQEQLDKFYHTRATNPK